MQRSKRAFLSFALVGSLLGAALPLSLPGCGGGSDQPEMVKPTAPPAVSAKDSMKAYLDQQKEKAGAKGTRSK